MYVFGGGKDLAAGRASNGLEGCVVNDQTRPKYPIISKYIL